MSLSRTIVCWLDIVGVDDGAFLGGGSTFHQFMHIGRLVMVQGSSAFGKDLPPFVVAAERNSVFGVNVIGLRRAGFSAKEREEIKAAFKLVYLSGLNISQALEKAATMKLGKARPRVPGLRRERKKTWHLPAQTRRRKGRGNLTLLRTIICLQARTRTESPQMQTVRVSSPVLCCSRESSGHLCSDRTPQLAGRAAL